MIKEMLFCFYFLSLEAEQAIFLLNLHQFILLLDEMSFSELVFALNLALSSTYFQDFRIKTLNLK